MSADLFSVILHSQFLAIIGVGRSMLQPPRFPARKASWQSDRWAVAAWSMFVALLLLWLFLRRAADPIQPADGLLFLALIVQVWLTFRTAREG
jgi:hypothetical protein